MDMSYFNYCQGLTMTSPKFDALFGGPPRQPESPLTQREMDLAASIQEVTEEIMLRMARHVHRETGMKNLCLAGGVALNCVGNGRILREGPFERHLDSAGRRRRRRRARRRAVHLAPAARQPADAAAARSASTARCSGPQFADDEIRAFLDSIGAVYQRIRRTKRAVRRTSPI